MKPNELLANENGSIMVVTLIILTLATMIGIAATITASIELQVSGNDMRYADIFYRAEAAAMVGARAIETSTNLAGGKYTSDNDDITLAKIDRKGHSADLPNPDDIANNDNWSESTNKVSAEAPVALSAEGCQTRFLPVEGPAMNTSLDMANTAGTQMHEYTIYGRSILESASSNKRLGEVIIEVGYKKRF